MVAARILSVPQRGQGWYIVCELLSNMAEQLPQYKMGIVFINAMFSLLQLAYIVGIDPARDGEGDAYPQTVFDNLRFQFTSRFKRDLHRFAFGQIAAHFTSITCCEAHMQSPIWNFGADLSGYLLCWNSFGWRNCGGNACAH